MSIWWFAGVMLGIVKYLVPKLGIRKMLTSNILAYFEVLSNTPEKQNSLAANRPKLEKFFPCCLFSFGLRVPNKQIQLSCRSKRSSFSIKVFNWFVINCYLVTEFEPLQENPLGIVPSGSGGARFSLKFTWFIRPFAPGRSFYSSSESERVFWQTLFTPPKKHPDIWA